MSAYIFCHCNATLQPPYPPAFRSPAGSSVCCSCFVALFFRICCHFSLSHSNTGLVWPNPDPAAGFCPVPFESSLSALSLSPYAVFNSISRVTFHCMHRFIIAKMENSPAADGFPSAVASLSLSLSLYLPLYPLLWFFITLGYTLRALCIRRFELNTRGFMFMFVLNILQVFRLASVLLSPYLSHASFFHFPPPSSFFAPTPSMDYTSANCC